MDDLRAVLDAVNSERVQALVLFGTFPRSAEAPDFPEGKIISARVQAVTRLIEEAWGEGHTLKYVSPSRANGAAAIEFTGQFERASLSPRAARTHLKWVSEIDTRSVARSLRLPTLVMHRSEDQLIPIAGGRWLSDNIPGARLVELPGDDHAPWSGDVHLFGAELEEFLTGSRGDVEVDRVLATVLFTDIVGSTERAVMLGDRGWKELLGRHHELVREEIRRHRGVEQDTAGDGFFATFDGPARAVRCAQKICEVVGQLGLEVRAGVHTGECERTADKMAGIAIHIGARVMAQSRPGEVLVSSTVKDLVPGSGLTFVERGQHDLKGVPGAWHLYAAA